MIEVFAAAMSSLDSSMNSVATSFTTDWYTTVQARSVDRRCLVVARVATVAIGLLGTEPRTVMAAIDDANLSTCGSR